MCSTITPVSPFDEVFARKHGLVVRRLVGSMRRFDSIRRIGPPSKDMFDQIHVRETVCASPSSIVLVVRGQLAGRDLARVVPRRYRKMSIMSETLASEASEQMLVWAVDLAVCGRRRSRRSINRLLDNVLTWGRLRSLDELVGLEGDLLAAHAHATLHTGSADKFRGLMSF